jgi:hypothetical protein
MVVATVPKYNRLLIVSVLNFLETHFSQQGLTSSKLTVYDEDSLE